MKATPCLLGFALLAGLNFTAGARPVPLRYRFTAGETNVYAVTFSVISETGTETSSGNIFVITIDVNSNAITLACQGSLKVESKQSSHRGPGFFYPGIMSQTMTLFPNECEIQLDAHGREIRNAGDYLLPAPLGKLVQSLFEPLPEHGRSAEFTDSANVVDTPQWLGPGEVFANPMMGGQIYGFRFNGYPQPPLAFLTVNRHGELKRLENSDPNLVQVHKSLTLESELQTNGKPRLQATSQTDLFFDRSAGQLARLATTGEAMSETEDSVRHAKLSFTARRLTGAELTALLTPPPPPAPPRQLTAADLDKIMQDLKSDDAEAARNAIRSLNGAEVSAPPAEMIDLVASHATDSDNSVRQSAANFLEKHATTNQVPVFIRLAKNSDWLTRQPAIRALGKLKDARAINCLTDLVARGGSFNPNQQDEANALISIGSVAESAVLSLLRERNVDTQRQACDILKEIGTAQSLDALEKLVGDPDQNLNQSAQGAVQSIKARL